MQETPLIANMVAALTRAGHSLPRTRAEVYSMLLLSLVRRWQNNEGHNPLSRRDLRSLPQHIREALSNATLAEWLWMDRDFRQDDMLSMSKQRLLQCAQNQLIASALLRSSTLWFGLKQHSLLSCDVAGVYGYLQHVAGGWHQGRGALHAKRRSESEKR